MVKNKHINTHACVGSMVCVCADTLSNAPFPIIFEKHEHIQQNFFFFLKEVHYFNQQALN